MKKLKLLIVVSFIALTCGCSVEYKFNINEDLTIDEEAEVKETMSYFEENYTYYHSSEIIDIFWERFIKKHPTEGYKYFHNSDETGAIVTNSYTSIDDYINKTSMYNQFFEDIEYNVDNNKITLKTTGKFYPYNEQDFSRYAIDNINIKITVPFKVIESNADNVKGNTYIWSIDRQTKDKKISIVFDKTTKKNVAKIEKKFYYSIAFGIIAVIIIIIMYVVYRVNKNDNDI